MPRQKADVFVDYDNNPVIQGVQVGHDLENDCYWIDIQEAGSKLQIGENDNISMRRSYIIRDFEAYYFSNILIEKTKYKVNIKAIYEKLGSHRFTGDDNIEEATKVLCFDTLDNSWDVLFDYSYYTASLGNLSVNNVSKNIYLVGSYIIRNGKKLYLSDFLLGGKDNSSAKHGICTQIIFQNLEEGYLYNMRPYLFDKAEDNH